MSMELTVIESAQTAGEIRAQVNRIQEVMQAVMIRGTHYGTVPGCGDKPALFKAGAEKLMMTFRLAIDPEVEDLSDASVRRYRVRTRVTAQATGAFLGVGLGECSGDEEKYAWREAACKEEYEAADPALRRQKWRRGQPAPTAQVRTNQADVANTVLKMAKKRSLVDAVLTVTAASDIFTQDIEDMSEEILGAGKPAKAPVAPVQLDEKNLARDANARQLEAVQAVMQADTMPPEDKIPADARTTEAPQGTPRPRRARPAAARVPPAATPAYEAEAAADAAANPGPYDDHAAWRQVVRDMWRECQGDAEKKNIFYHLKNTYAQHFPTGTRLLEGLPAEYRDSFAYEYQTRINVLEKRQNAALPNMPM